MATPSTDPILPRFKDKVMFISSKESKHKIDQSYVISSSFKGILRLSPNNTNTTYEKNDIQLSIEDDLNQINYSDAIKFSDEAEKSFQSEAAIDKRMIVVSDSDGYVVNFRFSENDIEFDNLGVIGITQAKRLDILSNASDKNTDILTINGAKMPSLGNASSVITYNDKTTFDDWDEQEIRVTGKHPDNSAIVYGTIGENNKRIWSYKQTSLFVKELIMEALLELETIPTGSVHWFPVTIEQYKELVSENGGRHNKSFTNDSGDIPCDPLVRDFLLCDGRKYWNRDFPELAKILWCEKVTYWDEKIIKDDEGKETKAGWQIPIEDVETNCYKESTDGNNAKCFRVPDLRHLFISAVQCEGSSDPASGAKITDNEKTNTIVGSYTPDCIVDMDRKGGDNHRHFNAYATWMPHHVGKYVGIKEKKTNENNNTNNKYPNNNVTSSTLQPIHSNPIYSKNLKKGAKIGILPLHNRIFQYFAPGEGYGGYVGFGERTSWNSDRGHSGTESVPAFMFFSRPEASNVKPLPNKNISELPDMYQNGEGFVGLSSYDVPSFVKVESYVDLDMAKNPEDTVILNGDEHQPIDVNLHGNENTGKFYAFLPLIKI